MIDYFSEWAQNLTLAIVIVSLFEMLLPNNKTKKYIKVVMGLYILFNIISPFVKNDFSIQLENIVENSKSQTTSTEAVDQTSMDTRLKQICKEELEKDIKQKIEGQGYIVESCKVDIKIEEQTEIEKITLKVKKENKTNEEKENNKEEQEKQNDIQQKLVKEVQKIKKVQIGETKKNSNEQNLSTQDISNIKNFLIKEYEVNEKCLKIN
jgi:stage III sporulation protein AF